MNKYNIFLLLLQNAATAINLIVNNKGLQFIKNYGKNFIREIFY